MPERRQAHRREPVEVEVRGRVLEAHPLPWLHRNDFGNELLRQYTDIFNSALRSYVDPDTNAPQLENMLHDKLSDPLTLVKLGLTRYPDDIESDPKLSVDEVFLGRLEWEELREIIYAIMDVNDLEALKPLVDPNSLTPAENGGTSGSGALGRVRDILNLVSTPDSSSQESPEVPFSDSPTENSSTSSENTNDQSGMSESGTSA